ncbi:MAG: RNA-binding protein [Bacillota bacterium]
MFDKEKLLSHLKRDEEKILGNKILDKASIVINRKTEVSTDFLNPHQRKIAKNIIKQIADINFIEDGGYKRAERKLITIFPDYLFKDNVKSPISILKISGNFDFCHVNHRDYLGALMGLGIKRKKIGDLLVMKDFSQIIVSNDLKDFIKMKLKYVNEVPVEVSEIKREDIIIPTQHTKEIKATVPSMRLDAVASAGFGDSRNKISRDIKNEKIKLNWRIEDDPAHDVEVNDMISLRGKGRVEVMERKGLSNRGRIKLILNRYT